MTLAGVLRNLGFLGVGLLVGALLLGGGASSEAVLERGDSAKSSPLSKGPLSTGPPQAQSSTPVLAALQGGDLPMPPGLDVEPSPGLSPG